MFKRLLISTITGLIVLWYLSDEPEAETPKNELPMPIAKGAKGDRGEKGDAGSQGLQGIAGDDGLSAYEVWLNEGNTGTEAAFFESLRGPEGIQGPEGPKGPAGVGLPIGGNTGQIPSKIDNTDYNVQWIDPPIGNGNSSAAGEDSEVQFNKDGELAATSNFRVYDPIAFWGSAIRIDEGDAQIDYGALTLGGNPPIVPEFGYAKLFYRTFPKSGLFVTTGEGTKQLKFLSPTYSIISGDVFHGVNEAGLVYLVDSPVDVTVTLNAFSGNDSLETSYYVIGDGDLILAQSSGTLIGAKTVFSKGEGCIAQHVPFDFGSSVDASWLIWS